MRTTKKMLQCYIDRINKELKNCRLELGCRYGYKAIDLYNGSKLQKTLISGLTAGQIKLYLDGMLDQKTIEYYENR